MPTEAPCRVQGEDPAGAYDADIIILAFDRFSETLEAVASARCQAGVSCYIWVLDQGSRPELRAGFVAAFQGLDNVSLYLAETNLGVGGGRNFLSGRGHGRIIVALDNDAVFADADVVAGALAGFARAPALGATGFRIMARDGRSLDRFSWGYATNLLGRSRESFGAVTFVGAGHAIRRAAWKATGGYDATLFFTWEEYDFCLRAIALGWLVDYNGSLAVIHKVAPEARIAWSTARTRYFVRNRLLICRRWGAGWLSLAPRILGYLIRGLRERRLRPTLRGIIDAARLDAGQVRHEISPRMRAYLSRHDIQHRGSWLARLRGEVWRQVVTEPDAGPVTPGLGPVTPGLAPALPSPGGRPMGGP